MHQRQAVQADASCTVVGDRDSDPGHLRQFVEGEIAAIEEIVGREPAGPALQNLSVGVGDLGEELVRRTHGVPEVRDGLAADRIPRFDHRPDPRPQRLQRPDDVLPRRGVRRIQSEVLEGGEHLAEGSGHTVVRLGEGEFDLAEQTSEHREPLLLAE